MPTRSDNAAIDPLPWLLEESDPGPRYLALRDVVRLAPDSDELARARRAAQDQGPIAAILAAMEPEGWWSAPGPGYNPKYFSTVWSVIALAQLGARCDEDPRIAVAAEYLLDHALTPHGQFGAGGTPGSTVDCLQGNLCWALLELEVDDPRLDQAYDWMARSVTGDGVAALGDTSTPVRYYAGKCGPGFRCGANDKQPCAWGAAKVMLAFGRLETDRRTPRVEAAIEEGLGFLLGTDPAIADYAHPHAAKPSGNWWKFGFPVFYITDLLQIVEALASLGHRDDPRLAGAIALVEAKRDERGRWPLEYGYAGKTWGDYGDRREPSKWVTIRALRVLGM